MDSEEIVFPQKLDYLAALRFSVELSKLKIVDKYYFDLQFLNAVRPFGMLLSSAAIINSYKYIISENAGAQFFVKNYNESIPAHNYASHVGFLKFGVLHMETILAMRLVEEVIYQLKI